MTHDLDDIRRCLEELPELCELLPEAAITRAPHAAGPAAAPGSRPPLRLDVLHLLDTRTKGWHFDGYPDPDRVGVLPYLDSWARDLEATALDERPQLPEFLPETPTVASTCAWLLAELEWAATLPQWPEMAQGIRQTWEAVRSATRGLRDAGERQVPCNRCGAGHLRRITPTRPLWECAACGHQITIQVVTLRQAAKILGRPYKTLASWSRRGLITPVSDGPRSSLYDLGQIRGVHAEAQLRQTAS